MSGNRGPIPQWYSPTADDPEIVEGSGATVTDAEGTAYLDFVSQLFCCNAGHDNVAIIDAMTTQAERIPYVSSAGRSDVRAALADDLVRISPDALTDVYFSISGSEANEAAMQIARRVQDAPRILTRWQSYHGSTYGAGSLTGDPTTRATLGRHAETTGTGKFLPPIPGAFDTDDPEELAERAADHLEFVIRNEGADDIAGIVVEPIAGASGAYTAPPGYFDRVRDICDAYDVLLIADEVISGFGRCGEWFGMQTEEVDPDVITFAKGVTSAYAPLAGVIVSERIGEAMRAEHNPLGQTYAGHPIACAAGRAAIGEYDDGLIANVRTHAPYLEERLTELAAAHEEIRTVRGRGYLWSIVFGDPETGEPLHHPWVDDGDNPVAAIRAHARESGVILGSGRPDVQILLAPPFTIDREDIDTAVAAIERGIAEVL